MTLPPLQPADAALLTRYLLAHEDIHFLLSQPNAPQLLPLLTFLANPDITPWLDHYRAIMAHAHQHAALNALTEVLRQTTDPTQLRLAATALLSSRTPRAPRPHHALRTSRPETSRSDPWASAPAPLATTHAPRQRRDSSLDASMPRATRPGPLSAFPELDLPLHPVKPAPARASPTTIDQAIATLNHAFGAPTSPKPPRDLDVGRTDDIESHRGAELDAHLDTRVSADVDDDLVTALKTDFAPATDHPHGDDARPAAAHAPASDATNRLDLIHFGFPSAPTESHNGPSG